MEEESLNNTNNVQPLLSPTMQSQPQQEMNMNIENGGGGSLELFGEKIKKKRGRPRKYDSDGNLKIQYLNNNSNHNAISPSQGFTISSSTTSPIFSSSSEFSNFKKGRGKPTSAHNFASYGGAFAITAGVDFIPHVVTVHTGEDVAGKILSFAQKSPRGICVLSANGAISNVTLHQSGSSGGLLTYEGRFEILCLSGSYTASENTNNNNNGMMRSRSGGLSVSLAGPDGRVIGGGVAGLLIAASPIQLVLGSFIQDGCKPLKRKYNRVAKPNIISQTKTHELGENFELIQKSQFLEQTQKSIVEPVVTTTSEKLNLDASPNHDVDADTWNGSEEFSDQRISPDINISLPHQ